MKKFVITTKSGRTTDSQSSESNKHDLLSILRKRNSESLRDIPQDDRTRAAWSERESQEVSTFDIKCLQRQSDLKTRNYVGWKMDREGNKVYTTFRNGGKVTVSGQEAFRLALADGKISKKSEKQEIKEFVPEGNPTGQRVEANKRQKIGL